MGSQNWVETLDSIVADGTQISNSTSETIVCPDFNIPAYYMVPGRTLYVYASGVSSNVVTTPGTLVFRVRWGGVAGTVLVASAAVGLDTTARTNALWNLEAWIVCRTAGASGTFMNSGTLRIVNVLSSAGVTNNTTVFGCWNHLLGSAGAPAASGNTTATVDTTAAKLLSVTADFDTSTNPTNLTCQQRIVKVIN
jgi:hypothetical protein